MNPKIISCADHEPYRMKRTKPRNGSWGDDDSQRIHEFSSFIPARYRLSLLSFYVRVTNNKKNGKKHHCTHKKIVIMWKRPVRCWFVAYSSLPHRLTLLREFHTFHWFFIIFFFYFFYIYIYFFFYFLGFWLRCVGTTNQPSEPLPFSLFLS